MDIEQKEDLVSVSLYDPELIPVAVAADKLGVQRSFLTRLCKKGMVPSVRFKNGRYWVRLEEIRGRVLATPQDRRVIQEIDNMLSHKKLDRFQQARELGWR